MPEGYRRCSGMDVHKETVVVCVLPPEGKPGIRELGGMGTSAWSCYDAVMRTTLELTAEAYHIAKAVARERNKSMGNVVSEFILERSQPVGEKPASRSAAGFPVFSSGRKITSEDVRALLDEDETR